jgi:hypothetical protein
MPIGYGSGSGGTVVPLLLVIIGLVIVFGILYLIAVHNKPEDKEALRFLTKKA